MDEKPKRKAGRPRTPIDYGELEKLAMMQCTDEELAAWYKVTTRAIEKWRKRDKRFRETVERARNMGRISVRRRQFQLLESGSPAIAIYLGKVYCGQRETSEVRVANPDGSPVTAPAAVKVVVEYGESDANLPGEAAETSSGAAESSS